MHYPGQHPGFFERSGPFALRDIARQIGAILTREEDGSRMITNVQPLHNAGPADLTFFDNRKYTGQLFTTLAGACILAGVDAGRVPIATATLTTVAPSSAFAPH